MATMPRYKFMVIGRGKYVHAVRTKREDLRNGGAGSECQAVRKAHVAGKFKGKGVSPDAALAMDECPNCGTHTVAKMVIEASMTPAERKARSKDRRDETLAKAREATQPKKKVKAKSKSKDKVKADKPKTTPKAPSATKAGHRSTGAGKDADLAKGKALELIEFAKDSGWKASLDKDGDHWRVTAKRGEEVIHVWYIDGKYDIARHAEIVVGSWTGKLRGAHQARRQMALTGRDRPHPEPGKGRTGPRAKTADEVPEDESPEDATKRVPFLQDDDASAIIEVIAGKEIRWRNGVSNKVEIATVPGRSKRVKIEDHPKKPGRRILTFPEVLHDDGEDESYGGLRSVALSSIIRVIG